MALPKPLRALFPSKEEREHLGGFYLAGLMAEIFHVTAPYEILYLRAHAGLELDSIVFAQMAEATAVLALEIPTGWVADRYGRKLSVVLGEVIQGICVLLVPLAIMLSGKHTLLVVAGLFALEGGGHTFVTGAQEAWVIDNLRASGKRELGVRFFGRENSLASAGGVLSNLIALGCWFILPDSIWYVTGAGLLLAGFIQSRIPELHYVEPKDEASDEEDDEDYDDDDDDEDDDDYDEDEDELDDRAEELKEEGLRTLVAGGFLRTTWETVKHVWNHRPMRWIFIVSTLTALASLHQVDAFDYLVVEIYGGPGAAKGDVALETNVAAALVFSIMSMGKDILGIFFPLLGEPLRDRIGRKWTFILVLAVPAILTFPLLGPPSVVVIVAVFLVHMASGDIFDPLYEDEFQKNLPSSIRATGGSFASLWGALCELASGAILIGLLQITETKVALVAMTALLLPAAAVFFRRDQRDKKKKTKKKVKKKK